MAGKAKKEQPEKVEKKIEEKVKEQPEKVETYVMCVTHLSWGAANKNHFYALDKPLINAKVMGKYASVLKVWLANGWIEKGSYKK